MSDDHPLVALEVAGLIAIGGFAGSNLRYAVTLLVADLPGILLANATGSFALGFLLYEARYAGLLAGRLEAPHRIRPGLAWVLTRESIRRFRRSRAGVTTTPWLPRHDDAVVRPLASAVRCRMDAANRPPGTSDQSRSGRKTRSVSRPSDRVSTSTRPNSPNTRSHCRKYSGTSST